MSHLISLQVLKQHHIKLIHLKESGQFKIERPTRQIYLF